MSGAISLVVTVSRTKGVGVVMSGDSCICVCGVEDCYCEGCGVGGWGVNCSVVECGIEGTVLGTVAVGAIVLVATVSRTNVFGDVMAGNCRIYICCVKGYCCERCGVGSCVFRLMTDDGGGMKNLGQRIAP